METKQMVFICSMRIFLFNLPSALFLRVGHAAHLPATVAPGPQKPNRSPAPTRQPAEGPNQTAASLTRCLFPAGVHATNICTNKSKTKQNKTQNMMLHLSGLHVCSTGRYPILEVQVLL